MSYPYDYQLRLCWLLWVKLINDLYVNIMRNIQAIHRNTIDAAIKREITNPTLVTSSDSTRWASGFEIMDNTTPFGTPTPLHYPFLGTALPLLLLEVYYTAMLPQKPPPSGHECNLSTWILLKNIYICGLALSFRSLKLSSDFTWEKIQNLISEMLSIYLTAFLFHFCSIENTAERKKYEDPPFLWMFGTKYTHPLTFMSNLINLSPGVEISVDSGKKLDFGRAWLPLLAQVIKKSYVLK